MDVVLILQDRAQRVGNDLRAEFLTLEKPLCYGGLANIQRRVGVEAFPVIEQSLYSTSSEVNFTPNFPIVLKVGHVHAGYGHVS